MTPLEKAKHHLPLMPKEVFDGFMAPLIINDIGWPFTSASDSLAGTDWFRILHPFSLSSLSQLQWKINTFSLNKDILYPSSKDDIDLTIINKTRNVWAYIGRDSEPSRRSLAWHKESIKTTGCLCAPITVAMTGEGVKILDGHHRVAAIFDLGINDTFPVNAWVGE